MARVAGKAEPDVSMTIREGLYVCLSEMSASPSWPTRLQQMLHITSQQGHRAALRADGEGERPVPPVEQLVDSRNGALLGQQRVDGHLAKLVLEQA